MGKSNISKTKWKLKGLALVPCHFCKDGSVIQYNCNVCNDMGEYWTWTDNGHVAFIQMGELQQKLEAKGVRIPY